MLERAYSRDRRILPREATILNWGARGMAFGTERRNSFGGYDRLQLPPTALALGGASFACVVGFGVWAFCSNLAGISADQIEPIASRGGRRDIVATRGDRLDIVATRGDRLDMVATRGDRLDLVASRSDRLDVAATRVDKLAALKVTASAVIADVSLLDPRSSLGFPPTTFAKSTPLQGDDNPVVAVSQQPSQAAAPDAPGTPPTSRGHRVAQSAAAPARRSSRSTFLSSEKPGNRTASGTPDLAPNTKPTILARLIKFFNPIRLALAYAPDDDGLHQGIAGYDRWTAVYDISAHVVYMPDGTRLEAHSGYGTRLDDPSSAEKKNRGVTPPNVYNLEPREQLFHGVRALRLIPEDKRKVFGRAGLLAHTFMLGPDGQSNGCVSFRNYDAFLQAYLNHKIKRLAVVTRL